MRLVVLVITCVALMVVVFYDVLVPEVSPASSFASSSRSLPSKDVRADGGEQKIVDQVPGNPYRDLKLASLLETIERPLFTKNRRAPAPPVQKVVVPKFIKKPQKKEAEYLLMGILKNGTQSVALLREKESGKYYRVEKGDILGNNRVTDVQVKSIRMEREDGTSAKIELKFSK